MAPENHGTVTMEISRDLRVDEMLARIEQLAHIGSWEWELAPDRAVWSDEVYRIFGLPRQPVSYELARRHCHPDDLDLWRSSVERALRGEAPLRLDYRIVRGDGEVRYVHNEAEVLRDADGQPIRMVGTVQDVTDRRREEEHRRLLEQRLFDRRRLESLGVLAGGIAHDFNNLLLGVLGNAELLLAGLGDESPLRARVEGILEAGRRAADLSHQMLAYSGRGGLRSEALDLGDVVRESLRFPETPLPRGVRLEVDLGDGPSTVAADPAQVRRVVSSLVVNSLEALEGREGSVRIGVRPETMDRDRLDAWELGEDAAEGEFIRLVVEDDGEGMTSEVRSRAFEPFFTTRFVGRGLGLSVVQGIVRGHGGALRIRSRPGAGTRVDVLFPRLVDGP